MERCNASHTELWASNCGIFGNGNLEILRYMLSFCHFGVNKHSWSEKQALDQIFCTLIIHFLCLITPSRIAESYGLVQNSLAVGQRLKRTGRPGRHKQTIFIAYGNVSKQTLILVFIASEKCYIHGVLCRKFVDLRRIWLHSHCNSVKMYQALG